MKHHSGLTIKLIETTQGLAGRRLDANVLAFAAHNNVAMIDQLLQLHEVLLREKLQLATHLPVVYQGVQFLRGFL